MDLNIFDSELKVMEVIWDHGEISAGEIAKELNSQIGWNRNTTYTIIKKCIQKGIVERTDPNFMCRALVRREQVQQFSTATLIKKLYKGNVGDFVSAFAPDGKVSPKLIEELQNIIAENEE